MATLTDTQNAMTPLVSVILPAYNAEKTVADAVASILLQTYSNWELIFIDDGSRDDTVRIARQFDDPRIRIYADGYNRRLSLRLNEGIDCSGGKYLARMDADDICFPDRLVRQVEFLETNANIDLLGTAALLFNNSGDAKGVFPFRRTHEEICRHPWNGFYLPHPAWMGRAGWFRKYRYRIPEVERAEDQDLLLRGYPASQYACLPEILLAYRVREQISLRANGIARRHLLQAQMREFSARAEWRYLLLSAAMFAIKSAADFWHVVLGRTAGYSSAGLEDFAASWDLLKSRIASFKEGK